MIAGDGSAADPASNGIATVLASLTHQALPGGMADGVDYLTITKSQIDFLNSDKVPKTPEGAISHRVEQLQLWSDFVYMVPPVLGYYGVLTKTRSYLVDAYVQCRLYRQYLRDGSTGLWRHVLLGTRVDGVPNDPGFWSTGNGWAAAGMLRVYATIKNSEFAGSMKNEMNDLKTWVEEVHIAMYSQLDSSNVFTNYADQSPTSARNFYDASSTALMAGTVFRYMVEMRDKKYKYMDRAQTAWDTLFATNSTNLDNGDNFIGYSHFTEDGWLTPTVNPNDYSIQGTHSPEGQAFVVMLHAARRDWQAMNGGLNFQVHVGLLLFSIVATVIWAI
ncbi:hypothetical protein D9611_012546 [Ephemerocybe angulata]|uniref:Six-hairpin glycosidase-like protein n=1 Tax=Ephemerocybe angulata TaxID=980116 RepID=A0A8H5ESZ6_9AGAR|nr:hypothetical protein D9611_012546 [Tulosesus angulatus]